MIHGFWDSGYRLPMPLTPQQALLWNDFLKHQILWVILTRPELYSTIQTKTNEHCTTLKSRIKLSTSKPPVCGCVFVYLRVYACVLKKLWNLQKNHAIEDRHRQYTSTTSLAPNFAVHSKPRIIWVSNFGRKVFFPCRGFCIHHTHRPARGPGGRHWLCRRGLGAEVHWTSRRALPACYLDPIFFKLQEGFLWNLFFLFWFLLCGYFSIQTLKIEGIERQRHCKRNLIDEGLPPKIILFSFNWNCNNVVEGV